MFERLTYWNEEYGCWSYRCASGDAANRLAAYEDSKLTPEEVQQLAAAKVIHEAYDGSKLDEAGQYIENLEKELEQYKQLANAQAEGRLVVLPCKVGDMVHYNQHICDYKRCDTHTRMSCCGCSDYAKNKYVTLSKRFSLADLESMGKTVFLTREAAEKALGGGEG